MHIVDEQDGRTRITSDGVGRKEELPHGGSPPLITAQTHLFECSLRCDKPPPGPTKSIRAPSLCKI